MWVSDKLPGGEFSFEVDFQSGHPCNYSILRLFLISLHCERSGCKTKSAWHYPVIRFGRWKSLVRTLYGPYNTEDLVNCIDENLSFSGFMHHWAAFIAMNGAPPLNICMMSLCTETTDRMTVGTSDGGEGKVEVLARIWPLPINTRATSRTPGSTWVISCEMEKSIFSM